MNKIADWITSELDPELLLPFLGHRLLRGKIKGKTWQNDTKPQNSKSNAINAYAKILWPCATPQAVSRQGMMPTTCESIPSQKMSRNQMFSTKNGRNPVSSFEVLRCLERCKDRKHTKNGCVMLKKETVWTHLFQILVFCPPGRPGSLCAAAQPEFKNLQLGRNIEQKQLLTTAKLFFTAQTQTEFTWPVAKSNTARAMVVLLQSFR